MRKILLLSKLCISFYAVISAIIPGAYAVEHDHGFLLFESGKLDRSTNYEKSVFVPEIVSAIKIMIRPAPDQSPSDKLKADLIDPNGKSYLHSDITRNAFPSINVLSNTSSLFELVMEAPVSGYWLLKLHNRGNYDFFIETRTEFRIMVQPAIPPSLTQGDPAEYMVSIGDGTRTLGFDTFSISAIVMRSDTNRKDHLVLNQVHSQVKSFALRQFNPEQYSLFVDAVHQSGMKFPGFMAPFTVTPRESAGIEIDPPELDFGLMGTGELRKTMNIRIKNSGSKIVSLKSYFESPRNRNDDILDDSRTRAVPSDYTLSPGESADVAVNIDLTKRTEDMSSSFGFFKGALLIRDIPYSRQMRIPISFSVPEPQLSILPDPAVFHLSSLPKEHRQCTFEISSSSGLPVTVELQLPDTFSDDQTLKYEVIAAQGTKLKQQVTQNNPAIFTVEFRLNQAEDLEEDISMPVEFLLSTGQTLRSGVRIQVPFLHGGRFRTVLKFGIIFLCAIAVIGGAYALIYPGYKARSFQNRLFQRIGASCLKEGWKSELALVALRMLEHVYPHNSELLTQVGNAYFYRNEFELSKKYYENSLKIDPSNWSPNFQLGGLFDEEGRYEEAIACYKAALRKNTREPKIYNNLGVACVHALQNVRPEFEGIESAEKIEALKSGYGSAAQEAFEKAIQLKPDYAEALFNLGMLHTHNNDIDNALQAFKKSISIQRKPEYMLHLAHTLFSTSSFQEAAKLYLQVMDSCDYDARMYNNLGEIYLSENKDKEAIDAFKKAIQRDVSMINAYIKLGDIYLKNRFYEGAMDMYKEALQINPDDPVLIEKFNALAHMRRKGDTTSPEP